VTDLGRIAGVVVLLRAVWYAAASDDLLLKLGVALAVGVGSFLIARDR
jgi:hypothetical protein